MHDEIVVSGWDAFVVAIPFLVMVAMAIFRLDAILAAPKTGTRLLRTIYGNDVHGEPVPCDPDGRPWAGAGSRG
jgi:hypothetical protein